MVDQPNDVMVSICCTAYNHEKYIEKALEGFIMQQCNFKFEILVSDDASTDNTASIIKKYESKYPNLFKVFYLKENQYSKGNKPLFNILFPAAQGKYIALCEGDDYWTDSLKLQKQVDFLEANEEFVACGCHIDVLRFGKLEEREVSSTIIVSNQNDLIYNNPFATLTIMMRNFDMLEYTKYKSIVGDVDLLLHLSEYGKFAKLNFKGGVYNFHGLGENSKNSYYTNSRKHIESKVKYYYTYKTLEKRELNTMLNKYIFIEFKKLVLIKNFRASFNFMKFLLQQKKIVC